MGLLLCDMWLLVVGCCCLGVVLWWCCVMACLVFGAVCFVVYKGVVCCSVVLYGVMLLCVGVLMCV